MKVSKLYKVCSVDEFREYNYLFIFSGIYFIKYKFSKRVIVSANKRELRVAGSDFALFTTFQCLIHKFLLNVLSIVSKQLQVTGLGFKYRAIDNVLYFTFGFSHLVKILVPGNIFIKFDKRLITLKSFDRLALDDFVICLKRLRPLDIYKAKGVRLIDEIIITKKGKQAVY